MPSGATSRPYFKQILTLAGLALILLAFLIVLIWPWGRRVHFERVTAAYSPVFVPPDTTTANVVHESPPPETPAPPPPVQEHEVLASMIPSPPRIAAPDRVPLPTPVPVTVTGRVDSWEDWNSSFADTVVRTYSAIFDSARLDTLPGGRLVFSPTGRRTDFKYVRRIFCDVDSVRPLVKYTFPGQYVDFAIGVGFASGVSLRGALTPRVKTCGLEQFTPEKMASDEKIDPTHNQFVVVLNSPPGYAYSIRTGIECADAGTSTGTMTYYTRPSSIEFRRMVKFHTLARDAADTILILTSNPKAIEEISKVVRRSLVNAVFVPSRDPSEARVLQNESLPNVRLHVSLPRKLDESFVVFNDSAAIIETNTLDPDFEHTVRLKLRTSQLKRIGYPRVTQFCRSGEGIEELRLLFLHYSNLPPQQ